MKIKAILVFSIITILVFIIYLTHTDNKTYYVSIKDNNLKYDNLLHISNLEKFVTFKANDLRITDVINNIEDNIENKKTTLKHALIKADLLTLHLGNNELIYKIKTDNNNIYNYIDQIIEDYDLLLKQVRIYCKEKIIIIGTYNINDKNILKYYNKKLKDLAKSYDCNFIDISKESNDIDKKICQKTLKILKNNNYTCK